jgi:hypothetical protein
MTSRCCNGQCDQSMLRHPGGLAGPYYTSYHACMTDPGTPTPSDESEEEPSATLSAATPDGPENITGFVSQGFFPADYATVESGKVYASGAFWSMLRFPEFPAVLPAMSLVAVIKVPFHANFAEHTLEFSVIDQDEKPIAMRIEGVFRTAPTIEHKFGAPSLTSVAIPIHGLKIDRPGEYSFVLRVDDVPLARYQFWAVQVPNIAMTKPPDAAIG